MRNTMMKRRELLLGLMAMFISFTLGTVRAEAAINGITATAVLGGTGFNFTAKAALINTADGASILIWGYANGAGPAQLPGPTLIVNQGATITINLTNQLIVTNKPTGVPVSIVFPGQSNVTAVAVSGSTQDGLLTKEALFGGTVRYTFTASQPGTYTYYSGTNPDLQVEMGLLGAIIVRPTGYIAGTHSTYRAYGNLTPTPDNAALDSSYDREFLFVTSEIDLDIHILVDTGQIAKVDTTTRSPVYWLLNGRVGPDTLEAPGVPWHPSQPYNCAPRFYPGEKVLLRIIGGGLDPHPFHTHGNHVRVIARDGRLLTSTPLTPLTTGADLATKEFTVTSVPGGTADGIFFWNGAGLGWDFYGHASAAAPLAPNECPGGPTDALCDHGKPFPILRPSVYDIAPGAFYSGSPFLGTLGFLPPNLGNFNTTGGFFFMWHSHNEQEIVSNNIFPGGMHTMMVVESPLIVPPIPPE